MQWTRGSGTSQSVLYEKRGSERCLVRNAGADSCPSKRTTTLLEDHRQTPIFTDSLGMQLNVSICQHPHQGISVAPTLDVSKNIDGHFQLPRVERI